MIFGTSALTRAKYARALTKGNTALAMIGIVFTAVDEVDIENRYARGEIGDYERANGHVSNGASLAGGVGGGSTLLPSYPLRVRLRHVRTYRLCHAEYPP